MNRLVEYRVANLLLEQTMPIWHFTDCITSGNEKILISADVDE